MIDSLYQNAQSVLNKEQLKYFRPLDFNLHLRFAVSKERNKYLSDVKSNVRKSNWMLDGRNLADYSKHTKQLLEHFSEITSIVKTTNFALPDDVEFIEDVFDALNTRIEAVDYSDYLDMQTSIYATPNTCSPVCSKVGSSIIVSPASIDPITLHYLRKPKVAKWTYIVVDGKPMFDETANDFQDVDMPESSYDSLLSIIVEQASKPLQNFQMVQAENSDQQQDAQTENKQ